MSIELIFRFLGLFLFGFGGLALGLRLLESGGIKVEDGLASVIVSMLLGCLVGFIATPFLTTRPYRALQQRIKQTPATDLAAAVSGLVLGLLIAVLLAFWCWLSMVVWAIRRSVGYLGLFEVAGCTA